MANISDRIYQIIKNEQFADPFSFEFNETKLNEEFGNTTNEDEVSALKFLIICNKIASDIYKNIFLLFNELKFSHKELREFCFIMVNKYYLDLTPKILEQAQKDFTHEADKFAFDKFANEGGQEVNLQFAIEIGGDILTALINLSYKWNTDEVEFNKLTNFQLDKHDKIFNLLWSYALTFINLRDSAYQTLKYENGKIIFRSNSEIKVESGLNTIQFLKSAGLLRANNNIRESFSSFMQYYADAFKKRKGVENFKLKGNILFPIKGVSDSLIKARADSNLALFYPHFTEDKLDFFDGLRLYDLLDLLVLIEECIEKLNTKNITEYFEKRFEEVPIKFEEVELVNFLVDVSGFQISTVRRFLASITAEPQQPYFWREPLFKVDDYFYFSLSAIAAPNHALFLDKWTRMSGFSLEKKELKFIQFIRNKLSELKISYQFNLIDISKLKLNEETFQNNVLIETSSLLILLEAKLFDFPIEPSEVDAVLIYLGNATYNIEEKAKEILVNFDGQKELVKIIISNYTRFSGLVINNIPIVDLTLFQNYIEVGKFRRTAITFHKGKPVENDLGILPYYRTEEEFNSNLKSFFLDPIPVRTVLNKLYLKEISITPDFLTPKFYTDSIDYIPDSEIMEFQMGHLGGLLNYEYYSEPENKQVKNALDQSIVFRLSEIFGKMAYSSYESYQDRLELYHRVSKTKMLGFSHLAFYILKTLEKLNGKEIVKNENFISVEYDPEEVFNLFLTGKIFEIEKLHLLEFKIKDGTFTEIEERKIISFAINALSGQTQEYFTDDFLNASMYSLALLSGLSHKYDVDFEFYTACSNVIDALNHIHKYQSARDFAEEILMLSIKNKKHSHGWNILFKCYTNQKNTFDASINGCLFLSSLIVLPEISNFLAVDALYGALKFFRNFGLTKFAKYTYDSLQHFDLTDYDRQKIALSYFNSFLLKEVNPDENIFDLVVDYIEGNIDKIISLGDQGAIPWLVYLYNIERLKSIYQIKYHREIKKYIDKFESSIGKESVSRIRIKVLGSNDDPKELLIAALLNTFETRNVQDFVHETQHLSLVAINLLQSAIPKNDIDGILLSGLVINDQTLTFKETPVEPGSTSPVFKPENSELKLRLSNYKYYLLSKIKLEPDQTLLWLFENLGMVFGITLSHKKEFSLYQLTNWSLKKTKGLLKGINNFYFNAKKDSTGNARCLFSNPRGEHDYNNLVQEEDYNNLLQELSFTKLPFNIDSGEVLIYSSIEMTTYPHNLIEYGNDFIAAQKKICNIISIERFIVNSQRITLRRNYSSSAWIPTDDQEPVISWGYSILNSTFNRMGTKVFTSTYPKELITTDLNIFLAHGVTDGSGFKAVYTNHESKKGIVYPYSVFGKGKIAILFICNAGSSHDALFSNSVVSFSNELLKSGYISVVAPFWPFDVMMSKIWLDEFLTIFNQGFSINEAVWSANKRLTKYDETISNSFNAPAGCLAMHLYGNPNVFVEPILE